MASATRPAELLSFLPGDYADSEANEIHMEQLTQLSSMPDAEFFKLIVKDRFLDTALLYSSTASPELLRLLMSVLIRIVTVGPDHDASARAFLIYENWVLDAPKLLDIAVSIGPHCPGACRSFFSTAFTLQPLLLDHVRDAISATRIALDEHCKDPSIESIGFVVDAIKSFWMLATLYPPVFNLVADSQCIASIARVYEVFYPRLMYTTSQPEQLGPIRRVALQLVYDTLMHLQSAEKPTELSRALDAMSTVDRFARSSLTSQQLNHCRFLELLNHLGANFPLLASELSSITSNTVVLDALKGPAQSIQDPVPRDTSLVAQLLEMFPDLTSDEASELLDANQRDYEATVNYILTSNSLQSNSAADPLDPWGPPSTELTDLRAQIHNFNDNLYDDEYEDGFDEFETFDLDEKELNTGESENKRKPAAPSGTATTKKKKPSNEQTKLAQRRQRQNKGKSRKAGAMRKQKNAGM